MKLDRTVIVLSEQHWQHIIIMIILGRQMWFAVFFNFAAFLSFSVQQFSAFPAAVSSKVLQLLDNGIGVQLFDSLSCLSQPMPEHTPSPRGRPREGEREREGNCSQLFKECQSQVLFRRSQFVLRSRWPVDVAYRFWRRWHKSFFRSFVCPFGRTR